MKFIGWVDEFRSNLCIVLKYTMQYEYIYFGIHIDVFNSDRSDIVCGAFVIHSHTCIHMLIFHFICAQFFVNLIFGIRAKMVGFID